MDGIPMTVEKLNLVSAAAYARCDRLDGLAEAGRQRLLRKIVIFTLSSVTTSAFGAAGNQRRP
jgi:hypothetical protein